MPAITAGGVRLSVALDRPQVTAKHRAPRPSAKPLQERHCQVLDGSPHAPIYFDTLRTTRVCLRATRSATHIRRNTAPDRVDENLGGGQWRPGTRAGLQAGAVSHSDADLLRAGNAGTADEPNTENLDIRATDTARLLKFCKAEQIDLAVIGPEAPLVQGMVDAFQVANVPVFGPTKAASVLEASKSHAKEIMRLANVPTADYAVFDDPVAAAAHVDERSERPLVVKADGLAAGKGVIVCPNRQDALAAIRHAMVDLAFGDAGKRIVIEEALVGEEASILAIVDGNTILPLEPAQDHKAAYDDDQGPNTGGMGAYSPTPLVTPTLLDDVIEKVLVPIVHTMRREDEPFQGILYAGLMITSQGPKVLEFNVRFGDPEAQPVLMRLKSDLAQVLLAAAEGRLKKLPPLEWDPRPRSAW